MDRAIHGGIDARCPHCDYVLDAATGLTTNDRPEEGNIGICIQCAGISVYTEREDGVTILRMPTIEEETECAQDDRILDARVRIKFLNEMRR